MVRDQIGLEEQVRRMQPPFVMYADFWFRDDFSDRDSGQEMDEHFDECLLMGSLYFPLNPGMFARRTPGTGWAQTLKVTLCVQVFKGDSGGEGICVFLFPRLQVRILRPRASPLQ